MRFTQDVTANINVIRGYGAGELRVNDTAYHTSIILSAAERLPQAGLTGVEGLTREHAGVIIGLQPEVVLLGTGSVQVFPDPEFGVRFLELGIGFEVMDSGAACRTFNVLVGEHRRVVALLLLGEDSAADRPACR